MANEATLNDIMEAIVGLNQKMDNRFEQVDKRFDTLYDEMDLRFQEQNMRLDLIESKLDQVGVNRWPDPIE